MTRAITIDTMVERWSSLDRPLFKGLLIDEDGCKCAQGDVLSCGGWTDQQLRSLDQEEADTETAKLLGISRSHAVLLRNVNDRPDGAPQIVLTNPEKILGPQAPLILAFWWRLDGMTAEARAAAGDAAWDAAGDAARDAAEAAAGDAAGAAAWAAAGAAVGAAAGAAAGASNEIQGADILERDGREPYFLKFFGIDTWEMVKALGGDK